MQRVDRTSSGACTLRFVRRWFIGWRDLDEPAAQLALLRIVVAAMFLVLPEVRHAPELATTPAALRVVPEGLHLLVRVAPISALVAHVAQAVCIFSALAALVGLRARVALAALTVSGFYLLSLSQLSGWVWHDMHLLWMAALLAASPCDETLAFDAAARPAPADAARFGIALQTARALLACIYFFPGFHKLATSGLAWALSDNLRNQLYWKWAEHGIASPHRFDHVPGLLGAGGLFVLAFEITFPLVLLVPHARLAYAVGGIAFHLFAWAAMRIPFASLWMLYVVLIPGAWAHRIDARVRRSVRMSNDGAPAIRRDETRVERVTVWIGGLLVLAALVQGARGQMRAYPFACYPTFQWRVGTEMPDLVIEIERADGSRVIVPHARDGRGYRTQRQWGEIWSAAGINDRVDTQRLAAYYRAALRTNSRSRALVGSDVVRVRFYRAFVDVIPEHRDRPARRGVLLATIARE